MCRSADYKEDFVDTLHKHSLHFWFCHRNRIIMNAIRKKYKEHTNARVLELGAGSGIISRFLKSNGYKVDASDMYASALKYLENEVDNAFVFDMISDNVTHQHRAKYDILILGDVVEHLKDPIYVLKKVKDFLVDGGLILVTVPALIQLWTPYDKFAGHKKRYNRKNLAQLLRDSDYKIKEVKYFMFIPSILLFYQRKLKSSIKSAEESIKDELNINALTNRIMSIIMFIEYWVGKIFSYPFGSSLIALGTK